MSLRVEELATLDPAKLSDSDRQALADVLRHALEGLSRHDRLAAAIGGLSPGAATVLRRLKGIEPGTYEYPAVWREPFGNEEDAEAAANELARRGLIEVFNPPGRMRGMSSITPTPAGAAAANL